ncbi:hypothetical protein GWO43_09230, partial [candidate division KSB1 bacterium]|nr:hypothetical protein [candidate division KSB1 bacterium]NIR72864.1 hypothetical protein [candidate division KSB1 bacterium]NIS26887.1 hypothetical protein [candidate division KSB1 bacterium]NIT71063.1 hypothetical protein [candidate division KSB1 bacterium]NIU27554.1 hypothetical protein [candidate division KSB1 bacterium]
MKRITWLTGICASILFVWIVSSQEQPLKRQDIIKFSHKYHQEEVGTACVDCHTRAAE